MGDKQDNRCKQKGLKMIRNREAENIVISIC